MAVSFPFLKKKSSDKVVLFIHGLENKPPKKLLRKWYLKSIREGFTKYNFLFSPFDFKVIYWADLLYELPLDPNVEDKDHPLYLDEPYNPSSEYQASLESKQFKRKIFDRLESYVDSIFLSKKSFINVEYVFDLVASRLFKDLHTYYRHNVNVSANPTDSAKHKIRDRLHRTLEKYRDQKIFLIAHSMGSIISFDVLSFLAKDIPIHTFVTIGSPLGLPMIKREIFKEFGEDYAVDTKLPTPENIRKAWFNLADIDDGVAINYNLNDDFSPNTSGISPKDQLVDNDYHFNNERNCHKSYGYLRTRELTWYLSKFLQEKEPTKWEKFVSGVKEILGRT